MCRFRSRCSTLDFVAGAALCEPPCADFVAGTAFCEPPFADFVAGTASGELEAENWRLLQYNFSTRSNYWRHCSATLVRGVSGKLDDENWRLCSTTSVRGAICAARS